jgi:hypothetical protein
LYQVTGADSAAAVNRLMDQVRDYRT